MKINKTLSLLALSLGATLPFAAQADGLSYSFVDAAWAHVSPDSNSGLDSGNAYGVDASVSLPANFAVIGSYQHSDLDILNFFGQPSGFSQTDNSFAVGAAYHYALTDKMDLVPTLRYVSDHVSVDKTTFSETDTGYALGLGLRAMVTDRLELNGGVNHTHVNGGSANDLSVGAVFSFTQHWGMGADYAHASGGGFDTNSYDIFVRFMF
jgi:opacity protein-like surface antigen